jgi:hypothetical protein
MVTQRGLQKILLLLAICTPAWGQDHVETRTATGKEVRVQATPATWAVIRDVTGPYNKHPEVFQEMMKYVGENYRALGACFGIYPVDPDATKESTLVWQVGVRVTPGKPLGFGQSIPLDQKAISAVHLKQDRKRLKAPTSPYRLVVMPEATAAMIESTVAETPKDGLSMFRWMAENGYVQVAATRMEYLSHEGPPEEIRTRILVPVAKRKSGLAGALPSSAVTAPGQVLGIVLKIQRADYEGKRMELKQLYDELARLPAASDTAPQVRYWLGFAVWRRALNGFNESADPKELEQDLKLAVDEFQRSYTLDPSIVDARIGAASCLGNLIFLNQRDAARISQLAPQATSLLKEAQAAAPMNPRLFWVQGASQWYMGSERGGGQDTAIETYQMGLAAAREARLSQGDPLSPSWGEPELLMNLAWANLHRTTPDLDAAERYARAALDIVPYWHYVRDILLPQITSARAPERRPQ